MNRYGKRCVLYPRVSTEMQVDGYSLEGQKNMLTRFADREEMIVVDTYEDAGKSGKSIEGRPAFQKMLRDIEDTHRQTNAEFNGLDRSIGKTFQIRQLGNIVAHQNNVRCIYCNITAQSAHGNTDIGGFQRRCIVDTITDHADSFSFILNSGDIADFFSR